MTTLAEIEAAADALPSEQKRQLLRFLASRLESAPEAEPTRPTDAALAQGDRVVQRMRETFRVARFDDPDGPAAAPEEWEALDGGDRA